MRSLITNKTTTLLLLFITLFVLSSCGGGVDTPPPSSTLPALNVIAITGVIIDDKVDGAEVCLDTNQNDDCDVGEPRTTSANGGQYTIANVPVADQNKPIVTIISPTSQLIDQYGNITSFGKTVVFSAIGGKKDASGKQNITPFTTMLKSIQTSQGGSFAQAESYLKSQLGIAGSAFSLISDYTAKVIADPYATEKAHLLQMAQVTTQLIADTYASLSVAAAQSVTVTNITSSQLVAAAVNYVTSSLPAINNAVDQYTTAGTYSLANATSALQPINTNNATFNQLFVQDTVAPVIVAPTDLYTEANNLQSILSIVKPIVSDVVDPAPTVTNNAPAIFPLGTTPVTWTATDANGNAATTVQNIVVQDTIAPVLQTLVDRYTEANAVQSTVALTPPTATDIFTVSITNNAPTTFPLGTTPVTWTATDANGNVATTVQNIVVQDTTAPTIAALADIYAEATGAQNTVALTPPTVTDVFTVTVTNNAPTTFPLGTTPVTWTATDANGNSAITVQNITVQDTIAPIVTPPADYYAEATATLTPLAINSATAIDLVDIYAVITHNQPARFPVGNTPVTWTATDFSGNRDTAIQQVTLVDTTPPSITPPATVHMQATGLQTTVTLVPATVTDLVDPNPVVVNNAPATFPKGSTTVLWTATDLYGNAATATSLVDIYAVQAKATIDSISPLVSNKGELVRFVGSVVAGDLPVSGYQWAMEALTNGVATGQFHTELGNEPLFMTETDLPVGTWRIHFSVWDTYGTVTEASPVDITVSDGKALADLSMLHQDVTMTDNYGAVVSNAQIGDFLHIKGLIKNVGFRDSYTANITLYDAYGTVLAQQTIPAIAVNGQEAVDLTWTVGQDMYGIAIAGYDNNYHVLRMQINYTHAEISTQNNQVTTLLIVGAPPSGGLYGMLLNATASGCVSGVGSLQGTGNYQWGTQIAVMGAMVNVDFFNPYTGIHNYYNTLSRAPNGSYGITMLMPSAIGLYTAQITVFDNNLVGSVAVPVNVHICPSGFVGGGGGFGGGWGGGSTGGTFTPFTDLATYNREIQVVGSGVHSISNKTHALLNRPVDVYATVHNTGTMNIATTFNVAFYDGDPYAGGVLIATTQVIGGLLAGQSLRVHAAQTWIPAVAGVHTLHAIADRNNVIAEANEYNNTGILDVTVHAPLPDLRPYYISSRGQQVSGIHFSSSTSKQGDIVNVTSDIYNPGTADALANSYKVGFDVYANNGAFVAHIGKRLVNALLPVAGVVPASINWDTTTVTPGWYTVRATADVNRQLIEDAEGNNATERRIHIYPAQADLFPVAIAFSNNYPLRGTPITLSGTVRNLGALTGTSASVDFYTGLPASGGTWFGTAQAGVIPAFYGEVISPVVTWNAPNTAGAYSICMMVGARSYCRSIQVIQGTRPDLQVLSADIGISPFAPIAGDLVSLSANISNVAAVDLLYSFTVRFYVDGSAGNGLTKVGNDVVVPMLGKGAMVNVAATNTFTAVDPFYAILVETIPNLREGDAFMGNNSATTSRAINVPWANAGGNQTGYTGKRVVLDGRQSINATGGYFWAFSSIPTGSTATVLGFDTYTANFMPDKVGDYVLRLQVNNGVDFSTFDTATITVSNLPPNVTLTTTPTTIDPYQNVAFTAVVSDPYQVAVPLCNWDFDFGVVSAGSCSSMNHTFTTPGNYNVTLTAIDNNGGQTSRTQLITVRPFYSPVILSPINPYSFSIAQSTQNNAVTFPVLATDQNIGDALYYRISSVPLFGTALVDQYGLVSYTPYANNVGNFTVQVSDGYTTPASLDVIVNITTFSVMNQPITLDRYGNHTDVLQVSGGSGSYTFSSSDPYVATVVNTGLVSLVDIGTALITVTDTLNNAITTARVEVIDSSRSTGIYSIMDAATFNVSNAGLAMNANGSVFVAGSDHMIHRIDPSGAVTVIAGSAAAGYIDAIGATARFNSPQGIVMDRYGNLLVADTGNRRIRKITPAGVVSTLAGSTWGFADGVGAAAKFISPTDLAMDHYGNVIVVDRGNHNIRKITPAGVVTTLAGGGTGGFLDGTGTAAKFNSPDGVVVDQYGNIFVADSGNRRVRKITIAGAVTTFAGDGTWGSSDGLATQARFNYLWGLSIDKNNNFYVAAYTGGIRKVTALGMVSTPILRPTPSWQPVYLANIVVAPDGTLYGSDNNSSRIKKIRLMDYTPTINIAPNFTIRAATGSGISASDPYVSAYLASARALDTEDGAIATRISNDAPTVFPIGTTLVTFSVTDSYGEVGAQTATVTVQNLLLQVSMLAPNSIDPYNVATFTGTVNDPYQVTTASCSWDFGDASTVQTSCTTASHLYNIPGRYTVTFTATDAYSSQGIATHLLTVLPALAPEISLPANAGNSMMLTGTTQTFSISARDPNASDLLAFSISIAAVNGIASVDAYGQVRYIPNANFVGDDTFVVQVTDGHGRTAQQRYTVTVNALLIANSIINADGYSNLVLDMYSSTAHQLVITGGSGTYGYTLSDPYVATVSNTGLLTLQRVGTSRLTVNDTINATSVSTDVLVIDSSKSALGYRTTTLAGNGGAGFADGVATAAWFNSPSGIAVDQYGNAYIGDFSNHRIRKISPAGLVSTLAGSGIAGFADGAGKAAQFYYPQSVAMDRYGNIYIVNGLFDGIRKITPAGEVTTLASIAAQFIAIDRYGNVIVADTRNNRIRKITPAGVLSSLAGSSTGFADGTGIAAQFSSPQGVTIDRYGNVFVADAGNNRIRKITPAGVVTTLAGSSVGFTNGIGVNTQFNNPRGISIDDASGNLFVADLGNHVIRKITPMGVVTTLAGTGVAAFADGIPTVAQFYNPSDVTMDSQKNIYVADQSNHRIRKLVPMGYTPAIIVPANITVSASNASGTANTQTTIATFLVGATAADTEDGVITAASITNNAPATLPIGTTTISFSVNDASGLVGTATADITVINALPVVALMLSSTAVVDPYQTVDFYATITDPYQATGHVCSWDFGDGSAVVQAGCFAARHVFAVSGLHTVTLTASNALGGQGASSQSITTLPLLPPEISPLSNGGNVLALAGVPQTINITARDPNAADQLTYSISTAPNNGTAIVDAFGHVIYSPYANFVGTDRLTVQVSDGYSTAALQTIQLFVEAIHIANSIINADGYSNLVLDMYSSTAHQLAITGGSATYTYTLSDPYVATVSNTGLLTLQRVGTSRLTVNDTVNATSVSTDVLVIDSSKSALGYRTTTLAGNTWSRWGSNFANGVGTAARFNSPSNVAVDQYGNSYIADQGNHRIRKITVAGVVSTLAGSGVAGFSNGVGTAAQFNYPRGIAVDRYGNVIVGDTYNHRIRKITPSGIVTTLAGSTAGFSNGVGTAAQFYYPQGIAIDRYGNIIVADTYNHRIRKITPTGVVTTLAGSNNVSWWNHFADGVGSIAQFYYPRDITIDSYGNIIVADTNNNRIRKITPAGVVSTLVGGLVVSGGRTAGLTNGIGGNTQFSSPTGISIDGFGNLFVADSSNRVIRKITPAAVVSTIAGNGMAAFADGIPTTARFSSPWGLAVDQHNNIYVADQSNQRIRKLVPMGYSPIVTPPANINITALGIGTPKAAAVVAIFLAGVTAVDTEDGIIAAASITNNAPPMLPIGTTTVIFTATDASGLQQTGRATVTIVDQLPVTTLIIWESIVDPYKAVTFTATVVDPYQATGHICTWDFGDGSAVVTASCTGLSHVFDLPGIHTTTFTATDNAGGQGVSNQVIIVLNVFSPVIYSPTNPYSFTMLQGTTTGFVITAVDANASDQLLYSITTNPVNGTAIVDTVGNLFYSPYANFTGSDTLVLQVSDSYSTPVQNTVNITVAPMLINNSVNLVLDMSGSTSQTLIITGGSSYTYSSSNTAIATVDATGLVTLLGIGTATITVTDTATGLTSTLAVIGIDSALTTVSYRVASLADAAGNLMSFSSLTDIAVDRAGNRYVVAFGNHRIYKVSPSGVQTVLAGSTAGLLDGVGSAAKFRNPSGIAVDDYGNLFVTDVSNNAIRKITAAGVVTTLAGGGAWGSANGTGSTAQFDNPRGIALDHYGNVYVADTSNHTIRKITAAGVVTTFAGAAGQTGFVNGGRTGARFNQPYGLTFDAVGNMYVADASNNRIRKITVQGVVSSFAGSGVAGFADGSGTTVMFNYPTDVVVDSNGNLNVADLLNYRIRKITPAGVVSTLAGNGTRGATDGYANTATFYSPQGIGIDATDRLYVADWQIGRVRQVIPMGYAPIVTAPVNITAIGAGDAAITSFLAAPTAIDVEDGAITTITNNAPAVFPLGVTTVTFTATDSAGNTGTASATVTVNLPNATAELFPAGGLFPTGWVKPVAANFGWKIAIDAYTEGQLSLRTDPTMFGLNSNTASVEVTGTYIAGNISFDYSVSSESCCDRLVFSIDGVQQGSWGGVVAWANASYPVTAGAHTFTWTYSKDGSVTTGADAAWIDLVVLP